MVGPDHPLQPTSFVGRAVELAELTALLADPACRLLTLIGPGGIGKTRLAIRAAAEVQDCFRNGVCFAALQAVSGVDYVVSALADALHLKFYGAESPRNQLLRHLRSQELLLILDNFEHLLDSADLLTAMLETAPRVKLLVTSRETLNLREEWLRVVPTMQFPGDEPDVDLEDYDATRLFIERARQARGDFRANRERQHIFRICRLVDGLPLAIELAAARIRTLSCAQIASEIQQSLDVLATSLRNVPERHRDMYAVFEPCWNRLTQAERQIFMGLSVFRGGFEREAAQQVTGASAAMLATLVDKSLLRLSPSGRYEMHELVRQFAEARLAETPDQWEQVKDHHAAYFSAFLHQREPDLNGAGQLLALADIRPELDNIRIMWRRAVAQGQWDTVAQSLHTLAFVLQNRSAWYEAAETMALATNQLQETHSILLGRLLLWQGHFSLHNVDPRTVEPSLQLLRRGMQILRDFGLVHAHPVSWQKLAAWADNSEEITQLLVTTLEEFRVRGDKWSMAHLLVSLGIAFAWQRDFLQAETYTRELYPDEWREKLS